MAAAAARRDDDGGDRALLRLVAGSDLIRQEVNTRNAATARARKALIARHAALNHESATERQNYELRIASARVVIAAAEERLRDAITAAVSVQKAHDVSRIEIDRQRDQVEHELRETAPAAIAAFAAEMLDLNSETCRRPIVETVGGFSDERSPATGRRIAVVTTNVAAIRARAEALRAARAAALEMATTVADPSDIEKQIGELRRGIPS